MFSKWNGTEAKEPQLQKTDSAASYSALKARLNLKKNGSPIFIEYSCIYHVINIFCFRSISCFIFLISVFFLF